MDDEKDAKKLKDEDVTLPVAAVEVTKEKTEPVEIKKDAPSADVKTVEESPAPESDNTSNSSVASPQTICEDREDQELLDYHVDPAVIDKLTDGVLALFLPNLQKAKGSLNEVLHNQEVLLESIQQENAKFNDTASLKDLVDTMQKARVYHSKLVGLKREMTNLMDKSTKLKKRAVKLQQQKKKEELNRERELERELERERALAPKIVDSDSTNKS